MASGAHLRCLPPLLHPIIKLTQTHPNIRPGLAPPRLAASVSIPIPEWPWHGLNRITLRRPWISRLTARVLRRQRCAVAERSGKRDYPSRNGHHATRASDGVGGEHAEDAPAHRRAHNSGRPHRGGGLARTGGGTVAARWGPSAASPTLRAGQSREECGQMRVPSAGKPLDGTPRRTQAGGRKSGSWQALMSARLCQGKRPQMADPPTMSQHGKVGWEGEGYRRVEGGSGGWAGWEGWGKMIGETHAIPLWRGLNGIVLRVWGNGWWWFPGGGSFFVLV